MPRRKSKRKSKRRIKNKKTIPLNLKSSGNDISKYPFVEVEWSDIEGDSGWSNTRSLNKSKLPLCVSKGYLLSQNANDVIPYSKVRVEWVDILSDSSWADEKGFNKMKLASPVNEGWLYNKDRYTIKMFASYDKEEDGTLTFGDRTIIPLACITKMTKIN